MIRNQHTVIGMIRRETSMSQRAFATKLGISIRSLAHYESGRTLPPLVIAKLSHLLAEMGLFGSGVFSISMGLTLALRLRRARC